MTFKEDNELYKEKPELEVQRTKKVYSDLVSGITHPAPCCCESCLYNLYLGEHKGRGRKFDKESFFLDYLADEIKHANVERTYILVSKEEFSPSIRDLIFKDERSRLEILGYADFGNYFKVRNLYKEISDFIKRELPDSDIDPNPQRIKLKLWRFRKSGIKNILSKLEQKRTLNWQTAQPEYIQKVKARKRNIKQMQLAKKIANFIYAQPKKQVTQRILQRKFKRKIEDLEAIKDLLSWNFGVQIKGKEGYRDKTTLYRGTRGSSRGRYWRMGYTETGK